MLFQGTNFCGSIDNKKRPIAELVYDIVIGWIFVFDIVHVTEGPTRLKNAVYYTLMAAEMVTMLTAWHIAMENLVRHAPISLTGLYCNA